MASQSNSSGKSKIPPNAISKVAAGISMEEGVTIFEQTAEAGVQLVNPVAIVVPNDALKQIVAQIILMELQAKQMSKLQSLPGNLPMPPGFHQNGRKVGG